MNRVIGNQVDRVMTVGVKLYPPNGMWSETPIRTPVTFEVIMQLSGDGTCYRAQGISCDWWPGDRRRRGSMMKVGQKSKEYLAEISSSLTKIIERQIERQVEGLNVALVRDAANEAISR